MEPRRVSQCEGLPGKVEATIRTCQEGLYSIQMDWHDVLIASLVLLLPADRLLPGAGNAITSVMTPNMACDWSNGSSGRKPWLAAAKACPELFGLPLPTDAISQFRKVVFSLRTTTPTLRLVCRMKA